MIRNSNIPPKILTVNMKFEKDDVTNKIIGFVTHTSHNGNSQWRGCRSSDNIKKMIVLIGAQINETIIPGVLYRTKIRRARYCGNFIAFSAKPVLFKGVITTEFDMEDNPQLVLTFGGKKIIYSPSHPNPAYSSLDTVTSHIMHRFDVEDAYEVSQRFHYMGLILQQEFFNNK